MKLVRRAEIVQYAEDNIQTFHDTRYASLLNLDFNRVISNKNPYLFRAKNINIAGDLVKAFMDAYLYFTRRNIVWFIP